jgi:hypothetical protein
MEEYISHIYFWFRNKILSKIETTTIPQRVQYVQRSVLRKGNISLFQKQKCEKHVS